MTITEFLLARIAEDEATAQAATPGPWGSWRIDGTSSHGVYSEPLLPGNLGVIEIADRRGFDSFAHYDSTDAMADGDVTHIARWNPARVLAECDAKRKIIEQHRQARFTDVSLGLKDFNVCAICHAVWDEPPDWDEETDGEWGFPNVQMRFPCPTLIALALPYAAHPDYQQLGV